MEYRLFSIVRYNQVTNNFISFASWTQLMIHDTYMILFDNIQPIPIPILNGYSDDTTLAQRHQNWQQDKNNYNLSQPIIVIVFQHTLNCVTVGEIHGKSSWLTFFLGWFSKDESTVIGSLSPRTKVYCCTNVSYLISRKQVKKCVMTILYGVSKLYRI